MPHFNEETGRFFFILPASRFEMNFSQEENLTSFDKLRTSLIDKLAKKDDFFFKTLFFLRAL